MARLKAEEHEAKINELAELLKVDGVDQGKASLLIQTLRENYTKVNTEITTFTNELANTQALNKSIVYANQDLIAKLGKQATPTPDTTPDPSKTVVTSIDDIAKELMK